MADDAFALSPITARASLPTQEDYDAICTAFMETARGRWFLNEYARRNRNADTRAVLDAVARLEDMIAAKGNETPAAEPARFEDPRLGELEQLVAAVAEELRELAARIATDASDVAPATPVLPSAPLDAMRHAGQMVQGVAWTLRESGADGRICSLLDHQARTIGQSHAELAAHAVRAAAPAQSKIVLEELAAHVAALIERLGQQPTSEMVELDDTPVVMPGLHHASVVDEAAPPQPARYEGVRVADQPLRAAVGEAAPQYPDRSGRPTPAASFGIDDPASDLYFADSEADADAPAAPDLAQEVDLPATAPAVVPVAEARPAISAAPALRLGDVIAAGAISAAPAPSDPFAPFARMSRAERFAYFS